MRLLHAAILALGLVSASYAADPVPPFKLPVDPAPAPIPTPMPGVVTVLSEGYVYVIERAGEFRIYDSPGGIVHVRTMRVKVGHTRSIYGKFVDGKGEYEWRDYSPPEGKEIQLAVVTPKRDGDVEIILAPKGADEDWEVRLQLKVKMGQGPIPPPKPDPKPDPKPEPLGAAWVIVVYETTDSTPALAKELGNAAFWGGLKPRGINYRHYDKDNPDAIAKKFPSFVAEVGLPAVLYLDATGKVLKKEKFTTCAAIDATLKGGK